MRVVICSYRDHSVSLQLGIDDAADMGESSDALAMLELFRTLNNQSGPIQRLLHALQGLNVKKTKGEK